MWQQGTCNSWCWAEDRPRGERNNNTVFVLWMETPERKTGYDEAIEKLLLERMPTGEEVIVAEASREHGLPFGVRE